MKKIRFKYFQADDVDRHSFYRIPKQLFTLEEFKKLSSDAKILYALMLDRVSLSIKNDWIDDQGRVYIFFSVEEVMEQVGCGKNKAIKCLKELDMETGIGLIQKHRQGIGKANIIYVRTFVPDEKQTSESPENKLPDVCKGESNKTNKSNNNRNNNKYHLILSEVEERKEKYDLKDEIRCDGDKLFQTTPATVPSSREPGDRSAIMKAYKALIRKNIEYDNLMTFPEVDHELAREIYELIVETVLCLGKDIVISSNRYPAEVVRSRFLKLNYMHVRYVMECLEKNTAKVKNIRKYLLAALFNAPATMEGYYRAEVQHDLYGSG